MNTLRGKIGLEIEGFVQDKDRTFIHELATESFKEIYNPFYLDDQKPEFPSRPFHNIGDLYEFVIDVLGSCIKLCKENNWIYTFIGTHPYIEDRKFASGHIHISMRKIPREEDPILLRRRLFPMQPFIALLSQNSPFLSGEIKDVKDTRLGYSHWSRFTSRESKSYSHYLSLAIGKNTNTLEVRIPSSGTLEQLFSIIAFIKTSLLIPLYHAENKWTEELFRNVIKWGGQALVPLDLSSSFIPFKKKKKRKFLPINRLFYAFINQEEVQETLDEVLEELPSEVKSNIKKFYSIISSGYTLSDYTRYLFEKIKKEPYSRKHFIEMSEALSRITSESYSKEIPFWSSLSKPERFYAPLIEDKLTIEELEKELNDVYSSLSLIEDDEHSLDNVLYISKFSLSKDFKTRRLLRLLSRKESYLLRTLRKRELDDESRLSFLENEQVIEYNLSSPSTTKIVRGKRFPLVLQLAEKEGFL